MITTKKYIHFVINPKSGVKKKQSIVELLEKHLSRDFEYKITYTQQVGHASEITEEAIKNDAKGVVAVGGDGTVNEVGKALIGTDVALGVLPYGSGNGFARHLKIPIQTKAAIQTINQFRVRTIDTATINGDPFLATAGLGFDAHVGWKFANFGKRGFLSYIQVTTNEFFSFKPKRYELVIDGEAFETTAFLINFANAGQYGNNAWIAPSASMSDGKLNVCILEKFPPHQVPEIIFQLFSKKIENSKYYKVIQAKEIQVKQADKFHIDGEPKENKNDIVVKVVPNSLTVIY